MVGCHIWYGITLGKTNLENWKCITLSRCTTNIAANLIVEYNDNLAVGPIIQSKVTGSINQSIYQHELAKAPHIQSSGAPEIQ